MGKNIQWKKTKVTRHNGERVDARAPIIVSASRSTDIPAFYAEWMANRLEAGYAVWYNPFNQTRPYYVSFEAARLFVFWTKNPGPMMRYLDKFSERGINYYFQFTLNDYEDEKFEPNLPSLDERIDTFRELSNKIGRKRVIWRFDPLIVTPRLHPERLLEKIENVGARLAKMTDKLVISFVDVNAYRKVQNNLIRELDVFDKSSVSSAEMTRDQILTIADGLKQLRKRWKAQGWDITLATCGESMDLHAGYGIKKNKCIDDDLIRSEFSEDQELMRYIDYGETDPDQPKTESDYALPGFSREEKKDKLIDIKDKGQRKDCGCIYSKDIGMYNTCRHFCVYCYANTSRKIVTANTAVNNVDSESIVTISR